jgi:hypothetical protein
MYALSAKLIIIYGQTLINALFHVLQITSQIQLAMSARGLFYRDVFHLYFWIIRLSAFSVILA